MKSEVRAILAADAEVAAMALRPAAAEVSLQREKVPARMLHSQGQEQADRCTPRVVVDDFAGIRKAGLTHPLMDEIEKQLAPPE